MQITLKKATKEYYLDEDTTITPVQNVSLDLSSGDFIVIIGRSGSGKTTLLNLAAGLVKPTSGEVLADGRSLSLMTDKQLSQWRSRRIGFMFQFPSLIPSLTILENVVLPVGFSQRSKSRSDLRSAQELLGTLGLSARMGVYPKQLSAGEQKRAVMARAFINQPEIILADEPTSDLDEQTEKEIIAFIREMHKSGVAFMIVTHSLQFLPYATHAYRMENGSLHPLHKTAGMAESLMNYHVQSDHTLV